MDASTIHLLMKKIVNLNPNIVTVHDCFGTTADFIPFLTIYIKEAFLHIYSDPNYLLKYH